ncbi:hypothetical protein MUN82_10675 [Hymenobacter aerilatus]|uniref:LVIVD repeat-containing protein n=1 Tax=Hymenobacter aerilatus TaxID=2932251 RepID=A0A8T9T6U7_9BACT|nr:hypothetical protein [Hymenobacter aerilatus]UOR07539.1 hypothetical protein MUN82_10675 [Hymenobacter aerilatus]
MRLLSTTFIRFCSVLLALGLGACSANSDMNPASADLAANDGKGGSLARFTVLNNTLYVVDNQSLRLFDLATPAAPTRGQVVPLSMGIETIYPRAPYLFLGTQQGMYIFDASVPAQPKQLAFYEHVVSCDPVVVDERFAYVTLRSGRTCGGGPDQLQVIDLTNLNQPRLARTYPMQHPLGLGVDSALLFVCDKDQLKLFSTQHTPDLKTLQTFDVNVSDVIPHRGQLLAIGPGGLYQYRYRNGTLTPLSKLSITPSN